MSFQKNKIKPNKSEELSRNIIFRTFEGNSLQKTENTIKEDSPFSFTSK